MHNLKKEIGDRGHSILVRKRFVNIFNHDCHDRHGLFRMLKGITTTVSMILTFQLASELVHCCF